MKLSAFANEKARQRYHATYDEMLDWPMPYDDVTVETSFGSVYARRSGNENGDPVVLLHGLATTSLMWQRYIAELGRDHLLYAVDTLGEAGRSVQTRPITDARETAAWLAETLTGLGHDSYHLVGLSRGGWLALNQAVHSPDRVKRVTAFDPGVFFDAPNKGRVYLFTGLLLMLMPAFARRRVRPGSKYSVFVDPLLRRMVLAGLGFQMRIHIGIGLTDEQVASISVPTRVVLARHSAVEDVAATAARLARVAPRIEVVTVDRHHTLDLVEPAFFRDQVTAR